MRGKEIRLERIMDRNTGRTIIVPLDHGVTLGPIPGLVDVGRTIDLVAEGGANAVIGHVGLALHGHRGHGRDVGLIMHLSASTSIGPDPNEKVLVNTVTNALKMGADGVSVHINVGADSEARMLADLGNVAVACMEWGMPLLAMMYPRGRKVADEHDLESVKLAARVAAELGADIVKTVYTGDADSFREVTRGCRCRSLSREARRPTTARSSTSWRVRWRAVPPVYRSGGTPSSTRRPTASSAPRR